MGSTKKIKKWEVEITDYYEELKRHELVVRTMRRGKLERYWIACGKLGVYMSEKYPLPKYLIKEIAKWLDAEPSVFIVDQYGKITDFYQVK